MAERVPRIRRAPLPADALIVVRGDDLLAGSSRLQAEEFRRRYPDWERWGLSGFYARNQSDVDDLAGDQLERFPLLRLYRSAVLEATGFQIVPTFRTPHVTIAFGGDLEAGLERLRAADHDEWGNPYHDPELYPGGG
jgi:hypothetical protein